MAEPAPPEAEAEAAAVIAGVRGLHDLWAAVTGAAEPVEPRPVPVPMMLATLGLGVAQVMTHLGEQQPGWADLTSWIAATAGPPDPDRVARWHAWLDGDPPPPSERDRQAAVLAADPVLDADDLATWERDGVVVLRGAIDEEDAAALADLVWATVGADPGDPATWARCAPRIMVERYQHPAMDVPRRSLRVATAFAQLHGHADLLASVDRLGFNPPERDDYRFPGPHLHWDTSLAPPVPFATGGILYLTDTTADQGALQVVPGFHRRLAAGWVDGLGGVDPRTVDLSAEAVPVPGAAGDLVIWRQEIPHGASPNRAARPRLVQYVNHRPFRWPDDRPWV